MMESRSRSKVVRSLTLVAALVLFGCGDDADKPSGSSPNASIGADAGTDGGNVDEVVVSKNCEAPFDETVVQGRFWHDSEGVAVSNYEQPFEAERPGLEDRQTSLYLPDGGHLATLSCSDGVFRFTGVDAEIALLDVGDNTCTSSNCPTRFAQQAFLGESVKVVTFGDSIPHYGPEPWFPARLATLAEPLVDIENTNVAVPGATSFDWLPDSQFFKNRIEPHADADVWVFSLGGNDLQEFVGAANSGSPSEILSELQPLIDEIVANIRATVQAVRALSPDSDIVWVIYPNYGSSDYWKALAPAELESVIEPAVGNILKDVRRRLAGESGLQIVDILGATEGIDLDTMLIDPLHLNEVGHIFYARELFVTLGGVIIDEEARGLDRRIGYVE